MPSSSWRGERRRQSSGTEIDPTWGVWPKAASIVNDAAGPVRITKVLGERLPASSCKSKQNLKNDQNHLKSCDQAVFR